MRDSVILMRNMVLGGLRVCLGIYLGGNERPRKGFVLQCRLGIGP